jgi:hypothetical protein
MTTITVVILARNSGPWITETLESVREQTHPRDQIETIVVDDGSQDSGGAIAGSFLARHSMHGTVLAGEATGSVGAAMNLGWRAASGQWVQFIDGGDVLAPDKFEVQSRLIPELGEEVSVICSSWQRLRLSKDQWLLSGPINAPTLSDPVVLKLVSPAVARLGAALFSKRGVQAIGGFSEDVAFALDEHFMLKMARITDGDGGGGPRFDVFVEAPSARPLFFAREAPEVAREEKVAIARQRLENVLAAQAVLRKMRGGVLTRENCEEIAGLCSESLRHLQAYDRSRFQQYTLRLRRIDMRLLPTHSAERPFERDQSATAKEGRRAGGVGALPPTGTSAGDRGREGVHDDPAPIPAVAGERAQSREMRPMRKIQLAGAIIAAALILGGMLALGPFKIHDKLTGLHGRFKPAQNARESTPIIVVAPVVYVEPSLPWPLPIEIGPPQWVPQDSVLQIHGLPAAVTLNVGQRLPGDLWAVPIVGVLNLDVQAPQGLTGRSELSLTLVGADGSVLAKAQTVISIVEPFALTHNGSGEDAPAPADATRTPPRAAASLGEGGSPSIYTSSPAEPRTAGESAESTEPPPQSPKSGKEQPASSEPPPLKAGAAEEQAAPLEPPRAAIPREPPPNGEASPSPPAVAPAASAAKTEDPEAANDPVPSAEAPPRPPATGLRAISPRRVTMSEEGRRRAELMLARGERDLENGSISIARQFFLRAAEAGLARGALLLAATYDEHEFARLGIQGVQPSVATARKWYAVARALGAPEADERLRRLAAD